MWSESFYPQTVQEVGWSRQKIQELQGLLTQGSSGGRSQTILMHGPSGSAKVTMLRVMLKDWSTTFFSGVDGTVEQFEEVLASSLMCSSSSPHRVVIMKELPLTPTPARDDQVRRILRDCACTRSRSCGLPVLIIVHTIHDTHSEKLDLRRTFSDEFVTNLGVTLFRVPPITERNILLRLRSVSAQTGGLLSQATLNHIAENANGDLRQALLQLQWASLRVETEPADGAVDRDDYIDAGHAAARILTQKYSAETVLAKTCAAPGKLLEYLACNMYHYFAPGAMEPLAQSLDAMSNADRYVALLGADAIIVFGAEYRHMNKNVSGPKSFTPHGPFPVVPLQLTATDHVSVTGTRIDCGITSLSVAALDILPGIAAAYFTSRATTRLPENQAHSHYLPKPVNTAPPASGYASKRTLFHARKPEVPKIPEAIAAIINVLYARRDLQLLAGVEVERRGALREGPLEDPNDPIVE